MTDVDHIREHLMGVLDHASAMWDEVEDVWDFPGTVPNDEVADLLALANAAALRVQQIHQRLSAVAVAKVRLFQEVLP